MDSANTFSSLQPNMKTKYPSPSDRKKRFGKIRKAIEGNK